MTWSIQSISNERAARALELLTAAEAPVEIKNYIVDGVEALMAKHGEDVSVSVQAFGHLCDGNNYDVTSATISVHKAPR